jgi:hypothetical protein
MPLYYDGPTRCWYYLSPRYGCYLPYSNYAIMESAVAPAPAPEPAPEPPADPESPADPGPPAPAE